MHNSATRAIRSAAALTIAVGIAVTALAAPASAAVPDGKGKHCSDQWCKGTGIDWRVGG